MISNIEFDKFNTTPFQQVAETQVEEAAAEVNNGGFPPPSVNECTVNC